MGPEGIKEEDFNPVYMVIKKPARNTGRVL
jgi:hypothetical protein